MSNFNWRGAATGLLAEGGRILNNQAARMQELEDQKIQNEIENRRNEAMMKKKMALEILGYTQQGEPVTRDDYYSKPEGQRPEIYKDPPSRPKAEEPHKYGSEWGKIYSDRKAAGDSDEDAKKYADEATAKDPKKESNPYAGKVFWRTDNGQPIPQDQYWEMPENERPEVSTKPPENGKQEKPQVSEKEARKEILSIDEKIAKLKSGSILSAEDMKGLAERSPLVASLIGNNKQMNPEDRDKLIAALEDHKKWLMQFIPSGGGILSGGQPSNAPQSDEVSQFIQDALK